jgi:murein DD-endopeptidase MepM/ murein hydrolase activator NlpD
VNQDRLMSVMKNFSYETRVEPVSAVIENSLFGSVIGIGEKDQLALDIAEIFGSDIDFYTDIQPGDSFRVLLEKKYLNGQFAKYGVILAAAFTNQQKLLTGFRFQDENGKPAYYAPDGKSLRRSFLKSPLKFARISSRFSYARRHPILRTVRPHLGVDYAARAGTPVQAVGAGKVISAGYSGGNGRMIRIRHSGGYETMYLHLSRIAVRPGAKVGQGQVIGYVGSTGLSTGPHLDFRVLKGGKPINPLKVIFPPGAPVSPSSFETFASLRDKLKNELRMTN